MVVTTEISVRQLYDKMNEHGSKEVDGKKPYEGITSTIVLVIMPDDFKRLNNPNEVSVALPKNSEESNML